MTSRTAQRRDDSQSAPSSRQAGWLVPAIIIGVVAIAAVIAVAARRSRRQRPRRGHLRPAADPTRRVSAARALPTFDGDTANDPAIGMTIPTVTGKSFDGTPVTIQPTARRRCSCSSPTGAPTASARCPIVSDWMKQGGLPASVKLTTVATGTSTSAPNYPPSAWLEKNDWPSPIMADSDAFDAATAFGLESYPYFVLVDADGKVVAGRVVSSPPTRSRAMVQQLAAPGERIAPVREGAAAGDVGSAARCRRPRRGCGARIGPCTARLDQSRRRRACRPRAEGGLAAVQ